MSLPLLARAVFAVLGTCLAPAVGSSVGTTLGALPASPPAAVQERLKQEQVRQRISDLEAATEIDEAERTRLLELHRSLLQRLESEAEYIAGAAAFRDAIASAPSETAELRARLAEKRAAAPPSTGRPTEATLDDLQQRLTQVRAEISDLHAAEAELDREIAEGVSSSVEIRMVEARAALAQIETEISASPGPGAEASEAERIARSILLARQRMRAAELAMLEQDELSEDARAALLQARSELLIWDVAQAEALEARLEGWLSELRQEEAERARRDAERLRRDALDKHVLIQKIASENAEITQRTEQIVPKIDAVRERRKIVETQLAQTSADYEQTTRSLELGITRSIGTALLEQRRNLPDARSFRRAARQRANEVSDARLELLRIERQLKELSNSERTVTAALSSVPDTGLDERAREDLRAELLTLTEKKHENLRLLHGALRDYLTAIRNLETQESGLIDRAEELGVILDERLLWIADAHPLELSTFQRLPSDVAWFTSPEPWREAWIVLRSDFRALFSVYLPVALLLAGLVALRSRVRQKLATVVEGVGKVRKDSLLRTIQALSIHLTSTLPVPAACALLGWRLVASSDSTDGSKAIGTGLAAAAALGFGLQFVRNLCRPQGLGLGHFGWSERSGFLIRRHLLWYEAIALPATFLVALTQSQLDPLIQHGLGRLAFIVLMVAAAVLAYFLLRRERGLFVGQAVANASTWLRNTRPAWVLVGMIVPLALAIMAASGYYYAALQLEFRWNQTVLIILSAVLLHAFGLRWLTISQRRFSLKVALERRAALAKKAAEAGEEGATAAAESVIGALEEIDVAEVKEQTQDLLRVAIGIYFVLAVWFAWVSVLPALAVLDNVALWQHQVMIDGEVQQRPITLANLGLALLAILITVTAARKTPGFLEIAVLQRLPLEPGVRYATRTLSLYTIVATGIVLAFNAIGVGWSSVQWLVAALTVGLGFGLQEIFANLVSGLIILLERPIRVGDTVTVGEISGVVTRIRMRATTITDWSRRELLVPNRNFITGELINWSLSDPILRLELPVGIAYGSDTTLAHKTMLRVCREHPMVLDQPESDVFFVGFGDNSLNFEARIFVNEPTNTGRSRIRHDLHMAIDMACREAHITIAFPQRDLHVKSLPTLRVSMDPGENLVETGRGRGREGRAATIDGDEGQP